MERRGVPTATVITSAFVNHAQQAATNLQIEGLPLVVPPHPLYDLTENEVRKVARLAYPVIIEHLTRQEGLSSVTRIDYQRPEDRR